MKRLPMSKAAAALLRALLARAEPDRDRILLTNIESTDWQSLTFVGERHRLRFCIRGDGAGALLEQAFRGLETAEFDLPGAIVADVALESAPEHAADGSVSFAIEALTIDQ